MNEIRQASRIRQALNHSLQDISPAASRRLAAARHLALSKQKVAQTELVLAGVGPGLSGRVGGEMPYLRQVLAIAALLLGMWIAFYWHSTQYISELEAVDSALLADDIPPEAFLDDDLIEWLKLDAESSPD